MDNNGSAPRPNSGGQPNPAKRRPANARRRRRSKAQVFKESYLPMVLLALAVILIIVIIVTMSSSAKKRKDEALRESIQAANSEAAYRLQLEQEAQSLILEADSLAAGFDYDGAIAVVDSFRGDVYEFDALLAKRNEYVAAKESLIAWDDPGKVISLSTHHLVAEPTRAFADETYKSSIKYNFITVNEFSFILQSMYEKGYILVNMDDIVQKSVSPDGSVSYTAKTLYLPAGKKPFTLIQTHNSPSYVFDNDGDNEPDCVSGFGSRLLVTATGELSCEYTNRKNEVLTGNYDLVPILESFIAEHPDFSYMGARATIAVTGKNFLFGYQTNPSIISRNGEDYYNQQVAQAKAVADKLKDMGYTIACYTYANKRYGELEIADIQEDLESWKKNVAPIVGETETLVFAMDSDIAAPSETYSDSKYQLLSSFGYHYFIGFCDSSTPWMQLGSDYVRHGRLTVNGSKLISDPGLYETIFDAVSAKDENRTK